MLRLEDYISKLDTERFGFKIAKFDFDDRKNNVEEIILFLKEQQVPLIITKVNCENIRLINQLEKHGFRIMDFQLGYDYYDSKENSAGVKKKNLYPVSEIRPSDVDDLVNLAEDLFDKFGHYFADERLDRKKCLEIYKDWTRNVCTKKEYADVVYAAYDNEKPIGYFAFREKKVNDTPVATGVIGAVSSKYSGRGIFRSMLVKGVEWAAGRDIVLKDVKVHATNYAVNAAFTKEGFRIGTCCVTMHCWNEKK